MAYKNVIQTIFKKKEFKLLEFLNKLITAKSYE